MTIVIPVDPHAYIAGILASAIESVSDLASFSYGTEIEPGVTPNRFIRYGVISSSDVQRVGDRVNVRVQVWLDGPEEARNRCAGIILAHLRAKMGRKTSGPITVPDAADPTRSLTQFTVEQLLIGTHS